MDPAAAVLPMPVAPASAEPRQSLAPAASERLRDSFGRPITDLRLSVTDRCNYRCVYCRSGEEGSTYTELPIPEYLRIVRLFVSLGIEKVRLTGGEPLLRAGLTEMVAELAHLRTAFSPLGDRLPEGQGAPLDLALTTNGHLLAALAPGLKAAGLQRVTVSMDAVDPDTFARITRVPRSFERVLAGVRAARDAGLGPVKVNCVLLRGFNDSQIEGFAEFSRRENVIVRFIEFMPLEEPTSAPEPTEGTSADFTGFGRAWSPQAVVRMEEIVDRLDRWQPAPGVPAGLVPLQPNALSETARRFTFSDGLGEIGIIAPVSRPFCGHCSRVRVTSDGSIRTCLFSQSDHDLVGRMRRGGTDSELVTYIRDVVLRKEARHHIGEAGFQKPSRNMVHIGG